MRNGVVRDGRGNEVSRNELCALMYELIERMLTVGSSSTPDDRLSADQKILKQ